MAKETKSATIVDSGHYQLLGTDRYEDGEKSFGPEYFAYRQRWNEYPQKRIVGDFPLHVDIESTSACNLKCVMCARNFMTEKTGFIDWDLFRKIVDEGASYQLPSIKLNYRGEPLLHPELVEMVAYAKKAGVIEVQFNTNGLSLDEKKIRKLINAGLDRIIFSFDGATRETYEAIRAGSNYERVINNIKMLVKVRDEANLKRPLVRVQMVKMNENGHEVEDFIQMWRPVANKVAVSTRREPMGVAGEIDEKVEHFPCPQIWQRLAVCWNGDLRMCCGDWNGETALGNIKETSLYEIWHGEKLNRVRKLHSEWRFQEIPVCARCEVNTPRTDSQLHSIIKRFQQRMSDDK